MRARLAVSIVLLCIAFARPDSFAAPTPEPPPTPAAASYGDAYLLERSAAALSRSGDAAGALEKYRSAAAIYERLLAAAPEANRPGLTIRLQECRGRVQFLQNGLAEKEALAHPLRVHFIDVGQGDSTLIQCPDGSTILIDGGLITCYPYLIGYLKGAGVAKINLMIATHPDGDHIGGLIKALQEFPADIVLDSGKAHTTVLYERFLKAVRDSPGTVYKLGRAGDRFAFGPVEIRLLHPGATLPKDNNNCSIVARLAYRDFSVLLAGDAEEPVEKEIMNRGGPLKSAILKVAHHGSRSSTSARFLSAVSPRLAVISVGQGNSYHLPRPEILRRLESAGAEILRTDESGAIVVSTDGRDRRVEFPGKASYPDYEIPPDRAGQIVADRVTLIYHLPGGRYYRKVPPKEQEYFSTEDAAQRAGYVKSWY